MTVRDMGEIAWEAVVSALSWIVAVVVLACLVFFAVADAVKRRRMARTASKGKSASASLAAASLRMELAS